MKNTTNTKSLPKGSRWPTRKAGNLIPIVYGLPGRELMEQSPRGEIEVGGCTVSQAIDSEHGIFSGYPALSCRKCEGKLRNFKPSNLSARINDCT